MKYDDWLEKRVGPLSRYWDMGEEEAKKYPWVLIERAWDYKQKIIVKTFSIMQIWFALNIILWLVICAYFTWHEKTLEIWLSAGYGMLMAATLNLIINRSKE